MAWKGLGTLEFIDTTMNKEIFLQLLIDNLETSRKRIRLYRDFWFQQDNDPKHTAKIIKKWFEDNNIKVLPWPPQSPDLNPIEHLWSEVGRRISNRKPKNKDELKEILRETWSSIHEEGTYIKKLVESMPRRIAEVIKAKGGPTKY